MKVLADFHLCNICGIKFTPTGFNHKYCSKACKYKSRKEYNKKWSLDNKEKIKEYQSKYKQNNIEKIKKAQTIRDQSPERKKSKKEALRRWRARNKIKHRERNKRWRKENPEKVYQMNRNRNLKKKGVKGSHTFKEWESLKEKFNYSCLRCKRKEPEIKLTRDHITPISNNGTNDINNIQPLCGQCNSIKHSKEIDFREQF